MKHAYRSILAATLFMIGFATGVYVQHRYPLGRWFRRDSAPLHPVDDSTFARVRALTRARRLVIVAAGQSNAANYGGTPRAGGAGVYAFAQDRLYPAIDPLPGGDARRGSVWSRLGARLRFEDAADAVVFAVVAQGSTPISDWEPGRHLHARLIETLQRLEAADLPVDLVLWQQGESEAGNPAFSGAEYLASLTALVKACQRICPDAKFLAAQSTYRAPLATNEQIRVAQSLIARLPGTFPGPNLDVLQGRSRSDGVHFSDQGLDLAADLWLAALRPAIRGRNYQGELR